MTLWYLLLNMFPVNSSNFHVQVNSVNIADLVAGVSSPRTFQNDLADFNVRPTVMHDSVAGDPMWLITEGPSASLTVYRMTGVLSNSASFLPFSLGVNPYSPAVDPLQPDGTAVATTVNTIDGRIMKAAEYNKNIVATQMVSPAPNEDDARWYRIDVSSGTPTLKDQGDVSAGPNT